MKHKKKLHMKKHITNYFIMFLTIFAIITIIFATISEYIYQDTGFAKNLLILGIVCALASFLLSVFFRINNITIVVQVIIVYLFLLECKAVTIGLNKMTFSVIFLIAYFYFDEIHSKKYIAELR